MAKLDKFDRIYQLHNILRERRTPISRADVMERLDCSEPTFFRLVRALRDYFKAPVELHEELGGYYYRRDAQGGTFELPGLWFNVRELQALATFEQLFETLEPGLLREHLAPLSRRVTERKLKGKRMGTRKSPANVRMSTTGHASRPRSCWADYRFAKTDE